MEFVIVALRCSTQILNDVEPVSRCFDRCVLKVVLCEGGRQVASFVTVVVSGLGDVRLSLFVDSAAPVLVELSSEFALLVHVVLEDDGHYYH